jgi:hypothetical protein
MWFSRVMGICVRWFWWCFYGAALAIVAWLLFSGCAVNFGSGTAHTDAREEKSVSGTNRVVDVKIGK